MASGYSGTPLPRKLGIKEGHYLALLREPDAFRGTLGELPDGVKVTTRMPRPTSPADVIVAFFTKRAEFERRLKAMMAAVDVDGGLWISWPKRASGVPTDITEDVIRDVGVAAGMVDNKVCAVDETWSGLRLVYRVKDRDRIRMERG